MSGTSMATSIAAGVAALVLGFAMQRDPGNAATDKILEEHLELLKRHDAMMDIFTEMAALSREFRNIVPWNVLKSGYGRSMVAHSIGRALWKYKQR